MVSFSRFATTSCTQTTWRVDWASCSTTSHSEWCALARVQLLVLPGSQPPSRPPLPAPRTPQLLVLVDATEADKPLLEAKGDISDAGDGVGGISELEIGRLARQPLHPELD